MDTPVGPFSCNPHVIELKDSTFALFHIGDGVGSASVNCTNKPPYGHAPLPKESWPTQSSVHSTVHTSKGVDGPWSAAPSNGGLSCNNPAPATHPNGTIYVVCHGGSCPGCGRGGMQTLYSAPSVHGPWQEVSSMDFSGTTVSGSPGNYHSVWEDPLCVRQLYLRRPLPPAVGLQSKTKLLLAASGSTHRPELSTSSATCTRAVRTTSFRTTMATRSAGTRSQFLACPRGCGAKRKPPYCLHPGPALFLASWF